VTLPTGLGKTFIASSVMFNFYRWFKDGLIFFVAPTKPLVNQQSHAFGATITEIPLDEICELNGNMP
jgi:ERCC4-related helicase